MRASTTDTFSGRSPPRPAGAATDSSSNLRYARTRSLRNASSCQLEALTSDTCVVRRWPSVGRSPPPRSSSIRPTLLVREAACCGSSGSGVLERLVAVLDVEGLDELQRADAADGDGWQGLGGAVRGVHEQLVQGLEVVPHEAVELVVEFLGRVVAELGGVERQQEASEPLQVSTGPGRDAEMSIGKLVVEEVPQHVGRLVQSGVHIDAAVADKLFGLGACAL